MDSSTLPKKQIIQTIELVTKSVNLRLWTQETIANQYIGVDNLAETNREG